MRHAGPIAIVLLVLCLGQGCPQVLTPPPCLSMEDVIDIPPGNGIGTACSGVYRPVTIVQEECRICEKNRNPDSHCDPPVVYPDQRIEFIQADGLLTAVQEGSPMISGSINVDGTIRLGAITTLTTTEGTSSGQALVLFEGRFVGNRIIGTMNWRGTANDPAGTIDLQQVNTVTYELVP